MKTHRCVRIAAAIAAAAGAVVLAGCATPATTGAMTIGAVEASQRATSMPEALRRNVALGDISGGKETNPLWVSNVGNLDFERALEDSLRAAGVLSATRQEGRYRLNAQLGKLDQPLFGFDMTVTANVTYTLVERATGKTVFDKPIATPYTATVSDAFLGTERLRKANEGAVRQNIARLLEELGALKVSDVGLR